MDWSVNFDLNAGIFVLKIRGVMTLEGAKACSEGYRNLPEYSPDLKQILDGSEVTDVDMDFEQMKQVVMAIRRLEGDSPQKLTGVVFAPGDALFGMARMYSQLRLSLVGGPFEVARTREGVVAALGVDRSTVYKLCGWTEPTLTATEQETLT